jgi:hypothetical protein
MRRSQAPGVIRTRQRDTLLALAHAIECTQSPLGSDRSCFTVIFMSATSF